MVVDRPIDQADPALYSQAEVFAAGGFPTWANPDISLDAPDDFTLERRVKVRNLSPRAAALSVRVRVYSSAIGLGRTRTLDGERVVGLSPLQERELLFPLSMPYADEFQNYYACHVELEYEGDGNAINNRGSWAVYADRTRYAGRSFDIPFTVANPATQAVTYTLHVLAAGGGPALIVTLSSANVSLVPAEIVTVRVLVSVPDGLHGTQDVPLHYVASIVARTADGGLVDGFGLSLWVDD